MLTLSARAFRSHTSTLALAYPLDNIPQPALALDPPSLSPPLSFIHTHAHDDGTELMLVCQQVLM